MYLSAGAGDEVATPQQRDALPPVASLRPLASRRATPPTTPSGPRSPVAALRSPPAIPQLSGSGAGEADASGAGVAAAAAGGRTPAGSGAATPMNGTPRAGSAPGPAASAPAGAAAAPDAAELASGTGVGAVFWPHHHML